MKLTAIVSEYNPFHNGHKYLIEKAREGGATHIAAIMGGNFLQRGECAIMDKYARAEAAVKGGVDLVLELPAIYAVASAEVFARGAVETLDKCRCVGTLCFGSEGGGISMLMSAAELTESPELLKACKKYIRIGYSHPRAMQAAAEELGSAEASRYPAHLLNQPNNTLGIEYIRALRDLESSIIPVAIERIGVKHNSDFTFEGFASASKIREMILAGNNAFFNYIPSETRKIIDEQIGESLCPASLTNGGAVLSILRRMNVEELQRLPDVTEGLENRLYRAIKESTSVEEIIKRVKCKRYTYARLSRIIVCAYLGIDKEMSKLPPQYIRPLAFNDKGTEILKQMKARSELPVIMSLRRDKEKLSNVGKLMLEKDILASDMYRLLTPKIHPCSSDYYNGVIRIITR